MTAIMITRIDSHVQRLSSSLLVSKDCVLHTDDDFDLKQTETRLVLKK